MAPLDLQELALALRSHFGPQDNSIKLSELLFYIESFQNSPRQLKSLPKPKITRAHVIAPEKEATVATTQKGLAPKISEIRGREHTATLHSSTTADNQTAKNYTAEHSTAKTSREKHSTEEPTIEGQTNPPIFTFTAEHSDTVRSTTQPNPKPTPQPTATKKGTTNRNNISTIKGANTPLPESLQGLPKPAKPIRAFFKDLNTLLKPRGTILAAITSAQQAQSIKAIQKVSARTLLVYPTTIEAGHYLQQTTGEWLTEIGGECAKRLYYITIHNIDQLVEFEELKLKLQLQNKLQNPILAINRLGTSETIRLGLEDPPEANSLLKNGVLLDYEIKRATIYTPRPRCKICKAMGHTTVQCNRAKPQRPREFFKESKKAQSSSQSSQNLSDPQELQDIDMENDGWTLIESRKRRIIEPESRKTRGRPRFTDKRASNQQSLAQFISPETVPEAIQTSPNLTQTPIETLPEAPQAVQASINE
jgi:hypothetical protein